MTERTGPGAGPDREGQCEKGRNGVLMTAIPRIIATLAAASAVAVGALAPTVPATAAPALRSSSIASATSGASETASDAALRAAMQALVGAGATGVSALVDDGNGVRRFAVGSARLDPRLALRPADQFRVGSITKTAVSVVALQLAEQGRLSLRDSIESWLPGVVPNGSAITLRMLLNHTSGIFNYTDDQDFIATVLAHPYRHWSPRELIAVATSHPPVFAPGTDWSYSNTNYILVGLVLQKATGRSVAELVQQRVIRPLHLENTYLAGTASFRGRFAHGYAPPGLLGDSYVDLSHWSPSWAWAAGALVSNAPDLARFYQSLLSGRLLSRAMLHQMTTTVSAAPGQGYGLGIFTADTPCGTIWGHDGGIPGYVSIAYNNAEGTRSAVVLMPTQPDSAIVPKFQSVVLAAVCSMFQRPVPAAAAASPAPSAVVLDVLGTAVGERLSPARSSG